MAKGTEAALKYLVKAVKYVWNTETATPAGQTNFASFVVISIITCAASVFGGSKLEIGWTENGGNINFSMGDILGPLIALIATLLLCVLIVGWLSNKDDN